MLFSFFFFEMPRRLTLATFQQVKKHFKEKDKKKAAGSLRGRYKRARFKIKTARFGCGFKTDAFRAAHGRRCTRRLENGGHERLVATPAGLFFMFNGQDERISIRRPACRARRELNRLTNSATI